MPKLSLMLVTLVCGVSTFGMTQSLSSGDPIGEFANISIFDRTQRIRVGKLPTGRSVCFFREEGSSHRLDVGVIGRGAFIRVAHGDGPLDPASIPTAPLEIFAGKGINAAVDDDVKSTGRYEQFHKLSGPVDYFANIPTPFGYGFAVIAGNEIPLFMKMVAQARGEFIIVQSLLEPEKRDVIAIYEFSEKSAAALLACAKAHL